MPTAKRALDLSIAVLLLVLASPLLLIAAVGIKLTSRGPIFYRAARIGRDRRRATSDRRGAARADDRREKGYRGRPFTMYKVRTMRVGGGDGGAITAWKDARVFPFGKFLRATKIDELPQLVNIIKGDMAVVGPRPEAPEIVRSHYSPDDIRTLQVPPGLTSPGSIYYYTHCESTLATDSVVDSYVQGLLPVKLALDRVYLSRATVLYDVRLILRTFIAIVGRALGSRRFPAPPELAEARLDQRSHQDAPPAPQDAPVPRV